MPRPHLTTIALIVALGAATTVGAAWVLAATRHAPETPRNFGRCFILHNRAWSTAEHHVPGMTDVWWLDMADNARGASPPVARTLEEQLAEAVTGKEEVAKQRPGCVLALTPPPWGTLAASHDAASVPGTGFHGSDTAFGFPLPCLWYRVVSPLKGNVSYAGRVEGGVLLRGVPMARGGGYTALPYRPIWFALGADSVLFAGAWWGVLLCAGAMRKRMRARRGVCGACAYDLIATAAGLPCPECGVIESSRRGRI